MTTWSLWQAGSGGGGAFVYHPPISLGFRRAWRRTEGPGTPWVLLLTLLCSLYLSL